METIRINKIDLGELERIHLLCDEDFIPKLSLRVNIKEYCKKIFNLSEIITIESGNNIAGLTSIYTNDMVGHQAYISSMCILKEFRGMGFSRTLMNESIKLAIKKKMRFIRLEVGINNVAAIKLYESFDFVIDGISTVNYYHMTKKLT